MFEQSRIAARYGFTFANTSAFGVNLRLISSFFAISIVIFSTCVLVPAAADELPVPPETGVGDAIIADPNKALALFGYDPVAYYTSGRAIEGQSKLSAVVEGLVWYFQNEGNREAFIANPAAYIPVFGGYDPTEIVTGKLVASNPAIFEIIDQRLYLFRTGETRLRYLADGSLRRQAQQQWPVLSKSLVHAAR